MLLHGCLLFALEGEGKRIVGIDLSMAACRDAVALLDIAARGDCVDVLARRIDEALDSGRLPDVDALRDEFLPTAISQRDVAIPPPDLHSYNSLIASGEVH